MPHNCKTLLFQWTAHYVPSELTQPIVAVTSVIDRGSEHDQPNMDGIAHVVEHLA